MLNLEWQEIAQLILLFISFLWFWLWRNISREISRSCMVRRRSDIFVSMVLALFLESIKINYAQLFNSIVFGKPHVVVGIDCRIKFWIFWVQSHHKWAGYVLMGYEKSTYTWVYDLEIVGQDIRFSWVRLWQTFGTWESIWPAFLFSSIPGR